MERRQITKIFDDTNNVSNPSVDSYTTPTTEPLGYDELRCTVQSNNPGVLSLEASIDGSTFLQIGTIASIPDPNSGLYVAFIYSKVGGWKLARFVYKTVPTAQIGPNFAIIAYAIAIRGE